MILLRDFFATYRSLPSLQKKVLVGLGLALLGFFAVPFFQIKELSLLRGTDNTFYYFWLRSAMVDGDWDFANDLEACNTLTDNYRSELRKLPRTEAGRLPNKYGIGWAVLSTPFYLVADGVVVAGRGIGLWHLERDGYNPVYQIAIQTGHFLLGLGGLLLAWHCVRQWCGDPTAALWGVALILLASPQLYYLSMKLSLSHNGAFCAVVLMTWAGLSAGREPEKTWPWLVMGLAWSLAVTMRFQLAMFGLLPGWLWCSRLTTDRFVHSLRNALGFLAGALPMLFLQFYAWRVVYGKWFVFTYGAEGERFNWGRPEILNVLFSPYHGLFYWHPFLLAGFAGSVWLAFKCKGVFAAAVIAFAGTVYVNGAWWCWWFAGNSFGSRAFEASLFFFMAGLAFLFVRCAPAWRRALFCAGLVAAVWNFYLMTLFYASAIDRNAPVTWGTMFEAGPRALGLTSAIKP